MINKLMKKLSILLFCLIFIQNQVTLNAQLTIDKFKQELNDRVNTITTAVPFLMITPDSRAGGMGDIGVATSPDANSQHWNAAKYSFQPRLAIIAFKKICSFHIHVLSPILFLGQSGKT